MKLVILCGGRGERFINSRPKPLNRVCGRTVGEWMVEGLLLYSHITEFVWVLNPSLYNYNIEDEINHWTKGVTNLFIKLPFETRDPSETLELALSQLTFTEPFVCLDNDNIYIDGIAKFELLGEQEEAAVLVRRMCPDVKYPNRFGFVKIHGDTIVEGREKEMGWGENGYSCGGYWFASPQLCKRWLIEQRMQPYLGKGIERSLLSFIMRFSKKTRCVFTKESFSIGTPEDCAEAEVTHAKYFGWHRSRIVVDLDNTLVTYPKKYGDYSTSIPQANIADWIRDKSDKGAEIIVSTARRMQTYRNSIGEVTANIGLLTLQSIKDLGLSEAEIHLGKPHGDIYIDDRAVNPFDLYWKTTCGDWLDTSRTNPINLLPVTRNVSIKVKPVEIIIKSGPVHELRGQAYYYEFLSSLRAREVSSFFPRCYGILRDDDFISLELEYIKGIPASFIWAHNLWGEREWRLCLDALIKIHSYPIDSTIVGSITCEDIRSGYIDKVEIRRKMYPVYELVDKDGELWNTLKSKILAYKPSAITMIHGDSFMGNIIFPMKGGIKLIDMRGEVGGRLTVCGDPMYDWAKLCTSLLGMDSIVYNLPSRSLEDGLGWIRRLPIITEPIYHELVHLSLVLMYGSIFAYSQETNQVLVNRIKEVLSACD